MGSSAAWFLSANPDFNGSVLVIEKDPSYEFSSTARTNSCIRQQFTNPLNVKISQFGVEFLRAFRERLGGDPEVPEIILQEFGYMYLANNPATAEGLTASQKQQAALGAATRVLTADQLAAEYPFYNVEDILLGCHNPRDEGYFDGATMFDWWRRKARQNGVEYVTAEVSGINRTGEQNIRRDLGIRRNNYRRHRCKRRRTSRSGNSPHGRYRPAYRTETTIHICICRRTTIGTGPTPDNRPFGRTYAQRWSELSVRLSA